METANRLVHANLTTRKVVVLMSHVLSMCSMYSVDVH